MPNVSDYRAIWAALELGGSRSLDDLEMTTGVKPEQSLEYLDLLIQHRYVRAVGIRRAGSGEAVPVFRLVRRTGPDAPYLDVWNQLVDPNERRAIETAVRTKSAPRRASLAARVRVAAEPLPSFTRTELMAAVFGPAPSHLERQWFTMAWNEMMLRGHVIPAENGRFRLAGDIDPIVNSIRRILKEGTGKTISRQSISEELGFLPPGPLMRHAVDLLKAEGLQVTRRGYGRKSGFSVQWGNNVNDGFHGD
jgi:hypothetical protein